MPIPPRSRSGHNDRGPKTRYHAGRTADPSHVDIAPPLEETTALLPQSSAGTLTADTLVWTQQDVARYLRVAVRTVQRLGIPRVLLEVSQGGRPLVRYDSAEVCAWWTARRDRARMQRDAAVPLTVSPRHPSGPVRLGRTGGRGMPIRNDRRVA